MKLLTQTEAARVLRCHPATILRLRRMGEIKAMAGRPVRIPESELRRFVEQRLAIAGAGVRTGTGTMVVAKDRTVVAARARARKQARTAKALVKATMR